MAFTYSGNPSESPADAVRFAVGDTDERMPQLQDGEIAYCLREAGGNVGAASVLACQAVITRLSRMVDQTVGSVSKSYSQMLGNYQAVLTNLRRQASSITGMPFVGGVSHFQNRLPYYNPDNVRPQFTTRMMHTQRMALGGHLLNAPMDVICHTESRD